MADEQEYEIEIVDDTSTPVDDSAQEQTAEQKAEAQAKAEQDSAQETGDDEGLSRQQKRSKYKQRIDELTRKYRDEERERIRIARERDEEREQFQTHMQSFQQEQVNSARVVYSTLSDNKRLLEATLETARNRGDTKTENQIQDKLAEVRDRLHRLAQYYPGVDRPANEAQPTQQTGQRPSTEQTAAKPDAAKPAQPAVPEAAKDWIDANDWLKARPDLHATVNAFDAALKAQGKDPSKPEFYAELTTKLKAELPTLAGQFKITANDDLDDIDDDEQDDGQPDAAARARQDQRPAQSASGVSDGGRAAPRSPQGKRKVSLTRDEIATAQRLGISNEEYAKQKVRSESNNGYNYID